MFASLSSTEKQDFATQLSVLAQRAPANTSPLQLGNYIRHIVVASNFSTLDCKKAFDDDKFAQVNCKGILIHL